MHGADDVEGRGVIRGLLRRLAGDEGDGDDPRALRAEIERLEAQNERLRGAMRHCIDCEYRVEVLESRAARGLPAAGEPTSGGAGRD